MHCFNKSHFDVPFLLNCMYMSVYMCVCVCVCQDDGTQLAYV